VVFISGLEEGLFPHSNSMDSIKEIEEERRLFYVAMTRSMQKVFLLYAKLRYRFGNPMVSIPSRFLNEIDKELILKDSLYFEEKEKPQTIIGPHDVKWIPLPDKKMKIKKESSVNDHYQLIKAGTFVEHGLFGRGMIVEVRGLGENTKVIVDFDNGQRKTLMMTYANLKIVNID
jgi:DNA helicase-2/ATP-dependent DNA helicase PcrA